MPHARISLLLPLGALVAMAFAIHAAIASQNHAAAQAAGRSGAAARVLTTMVNQETGLRGFLLTGDERFLEPYRSGRRAAETAERDVRRESGGDRPTLALMDGHERLERQWHRLADASIAAKRADRDGPLDLAAMLERKRLMDQIRANDQQLQQRLGERRTADLRAVSRRSTTLVILVTGLLGLAAWIVLDTAGRRRRTLMTGELDYRQSQREFVDVIQVVRSEREAHDLVKRHLELRLPGARATVLNRNNSDNRLEPVTPVEPGTPLAEGLRDAEPASCVAVRLARRHDDGAAAGRRALLECKVCGGVPGTTSCRPLLVGGQVIGSVLVEQDRPLDDDGDRRLGDTVAQAAPMLSNLRNLAIAERRASTDALTGLPNRRAVADTLKRMTAQAARSVQPLAALTLDLDRFKDINDRFGHDKGDTVLAQVAAVLTSSVRASDFVGRLGGEEFVVLAPDTGVEGATVLAANLREAIEREPVAGLDRAVTASIGIAVLPDHAGSDDALLRLSDRALYAAKAAGRNRVEVVADTTAAQA